MKNHLNNKLVIGYIGYRSTLAKAFKKQFKKKINFKIYYGDITKQKDIKNWLIKNKDISILVNFAAISSVVNCERKKKRALMVNSTAVINLLNIINKLRLPKFEYFLAISSSHVFKKSNYKLKENSIKKPTNYYGFTKLSMEKFILNNYKRFFFKIGIARIFNYYIKYSKKSFFINDILHKFKKKDKILKFKNTNTLRDYISINDINTAIFKMIDLKLAKDFNICSGKKTNLNDIIKKIHKKYNNKKIFFSNKRVGSLVGSNNKLKNNRWKISNYNVLDDL